MTWVRPALKTGVRRLSAKLAAQKRLVIFFFLENFLLGFLSKHFDKSED